jgi:hypothetical protein
MRRERDEEGGTPEEEIEEIYFRTRDYVDLSKITAWDELNIQNQLISAYAQHGGDKKARDFQALESMASSRLMERFSRNERIKDTFFAGRIKEEKVRGKPRFTLQAGVSPFVSPEGKKYTAGKFLRGRTREETIKFLEGRLPATPMQKSLADLKESDIRPLNIRGRTYFQMPKGYPMGGRFLAGKTRAEAYKGVKQ